MRPLRIEIEGFMAYRSPETVDLSEVDLFALTGPTGSGKSTVIDAMVFALYGKTPRFGGRAPGQVINASSDWGRVQFTFDLGEITYTVARRIERERGVTEASLVADGKNALASGSKEVGQKIPEILGLEYEHFVRAVVLPQGKFARFLSDKPADRQDLLRALLDIGLFDQIKVLANQRAKVAESALASARGRLERLDKVTPDMIAAATVRLEALRVAETGIQTHLVEIAGLRGEVESSEKSFALLESRLADLGKVAVPTGIDDIGHVQAEAAEAAKAVTAELESAVSESKRLRLEMEKLPELAQLKSWREMYDRRFELNSRLEQIDLGKLADRCREDEKALAEAQARFDELHAANAAHGLRSGLAEGDTCPVCAQVVAGVPTGDAATDSELAEARTSVETGRLSLREARSAHDRAKGEVETVADQVAALDENLEHAPGSDQVDAQMANAVDLAAVIERATTEELETRSRAEETRATLASVDKLSDELRQNLVAAVARLEDEDPPEPDEDVVAGWHSFDQWRLEAAARLEAERSGVHQELEAKREALAGRTAQLDRILQEMGLEAPDEPRTAVAVAISKQEQQVSGLEAALQQARELTEEVATQTARLNIASALGEHLKANKFEAWVMEEAMDALVMGSNELLATLSGGAYSLDHVDRGFEVIDHFNADQRRSTQSLSGGETFLVSLALSLAMASQLVELSGSSTRLESVFLDEGFGTLDSESLDVVDSVLNELAGQGRTVGIVTHVRDLAERMPIRFEVSKGSDGSSIREVRG